MSELDPLRWLDDELSQRAQAGLLRIRSMRSGAQGPRIVMDGKSLVNLGANDYLGLAADKRIKDAAILAVQRGGWGSGASPLICGRSALHAELERHMSAFEGTAATLLFPTGYAANLATIPALVGKPDIIFSDAHNHASIIDGCRLSGARICVYRHNDVDHLAQLLAHAGPSRRRLIVTDTLFSMDGDLAPLPELAELARTYDCMFMVDEAHATGVFGSQGRGVGQSMDCEAGIHIKVGTLSKGLGSCGGFVSGSEPLIEWLRNLARGHVFSTAAPAATAAAGLTALAIIRDEPWRRTTLLQRAAHLRERLQQLGWNTLSSQSQIIPIVVGSPERAVALAAELREQGLFIPAIRPPSVPQGGSLLRVSLNYLHPAEVEQRLVQSLTAVTQQSSLLDGPPS